MLSLVVGDIDFLYGSLRVHDPGQNIVEHMHPTGHSQLARKLILDELFDLSLYQALHKLSTGDTRSVLQELIQVEEKHYAFWQNFFHTHVESLDLSRRVKLWVIVLACRLFGTHAVHLVLEAIEV